MARKNALRLRINGTIASAGKANVISEYPQADLYWCIEQWTWEISKATSGGNTRVRLVIIGHGYDIVLDEVDNPVAARRYSYNQTFWIFPGERIAIQVDQAQASTDVTSEAIGYFQKYTEAEE